MRENCRDYGTPEPEYELSERETGLTFRSSGKAIIISEIEKAGLELNERQKKAFKYSCDKGSITNREYRELCGVSNKTASLELSEMIDKELLAKRGKGRGVKYEPKLG